ncbi:hypothetical protein RFI_35609, partial [Reticulomyxa filosa]
MKIEMKFNIVLKIFCIVKLLLLIIVMQRYFTKCNIYFSFQNISYVYISSVFPFLNKSSNIFFILHHERVSQEKTKKVIRINSNLLMKVKSKLSLHFYYFFYLSLLHVIEIVKRRRRDPNHYHHWIRTLNIQLGWIKDFDKLVVNYL